MCFGIPTDMYAIASVSLFPNPQCNGFAPLFVKSHFNSLKTLILKTSGFLKIISLLRESNKDPGEVINGPSGKVTPFYFIE